MTFGQVGAEFPHLATELSRLSGPSLDDAVHRIVETALTTTGLEVPSRDKADVERLAWSLDDTAWKLQEDAEQGRTTQIAYHRAFLKARAASSLLELLEGRYGPAVYEATHALSSNEERVLSLLSAAE
jgi:hypothetical protein